MICTYNPAIKARITGIMAKINPFKKPKDGGGKTGGRKTGGSKSKKKSGKEEA